MGVVYKLKPEILDFILQQKKEAPSLSCRKLVDIVEQTFHVHVSKSSVNAIIKEHALSNPVGRASVFKAPKNFFIPQEKKEFLLANVVPFLTGQKEEQRPVLMEAREDVVKGDPVLMRLMPDILAKPVERKKKEKIWEDKGLLYEDAGTIFLRASLWEVSREPILGGLLKTWSGAPLEYASTPAQWEECLFHQEAQRDTLQTVSDKRFFWEELPEIDEKAALLKKEHLTVLEEASWEISLKGLLATAGAVRLCTQKGKVFYLQPGLKKVYGPQEKTNNSMAPLYKTTEMVADRLINNVKPFISAISLKDPAGKKMFLELTTALEGREDMLERIEILDGQENVLNVFEGFSFERCGYVFLSEAQDLFREPSENVLKQDAIFVDPLCDEEVGVDVGSVLLDGTIFTVARKKKQEGLSQEVFISNLLDQHEKREDVLTAAVGFFPYGRTENVKISTNPVLCEGLIALGQKNVLEWLRGVVFCLAEKRYFDTKDVLTTAMALPGYIKKNRDFLYVKLVLQAGIVFEEEIKAAVRRINENVIFDRDGRRVWVFFE